MCHRTHAVDVLIPQRQRLNYIPINIINIISKIVSHHVDCVPYIPNRGARRPTATPSGMAKPYQARPGLARLCEGRLGLAKPCTNYNDAT